MEVTINDPLAETTVKLAEGFCLIERKDVEVTGEVIASKFVIDIVRERARQRKLLVDGRLWGARLVVREGMSNDRLILRGEPKPRPRWWS